MALIGPDLLPQPGPPPGLFDLLGTPTLWSTALNAILGGELLPAKWRASPQGCSGPLSVLDARRLQDSPAPRACAAPTSSARTESSAPHRRLLALSSFPSCDRRRVSAASPVVSLAPFGAPFLSSYLCTPVPASAVASEAGPAFFPKSSFFGKEKAVRPASFPAVPVPR